MNTSEIVVYPKNSIVEHSANREINIVCKR